MSRIPLRRTILYAVLAIVGLAVAYLVVVAPLRSVDTGAGDDAPPDADRATGEATPTGPVPATANTPAAPSGVPMPVGDLPGWKQVFTDDFTGTTLEQPKWIVYEGQPENDPGGWFDPSRVSVRDGMLVIGAWQDPARDNLYATGGVSNRHSHTGPYGRYQIRFRADQGTGIAYVVLLWPSDDNEYPPEIDIAEDNGKDRQTVYGVLHPTDQQTYRIEEFQVKADATKWHTVGLEWTPGRLVYTLDGEVWARTDGGQVPTEQMSLALQTQAWYCGHGWEACPDRSTPERVNLEVDWVVIYDLADGDPAD